MVTHRVSRKMQNACLVLETEKVQLKVKRAELMAES